MSTLNLLQRTLRPKNLPLSNLKTLSLRALPQNTGLARYGSTRYVRISTPGGPKKEPPKNSGWRSWNAGRTGMVVVIGLGSVYYISHLEQVPDTGRWRYMNTSLSTEAKLGEMMRKQLLQELAPATLPPNHPLNKHVRRVASRILHASNLGTLSGEVQPASWSPFGLGSMVDSDTWSPEAEFGAAPDEGRVYGPKKQWDVIVVNDNKTINAMANPGLIVVYTGILPICQDEEGLAAVLAHEIGHVVARHTAERISSQTILRAIGVLLYMAGLDFGLIDLSTTLLVELPNSRTQELEADIIGLRLMSRACYNPEAAPQMFSRLGQIESKMGKHLSFLQTHPSSASRVKQLEERLPEAFSILALNPECGNIRQQLESFRETAHSVKFDRQNNALDIS